MKFIIIVLITSWVPRVAFSAAGINAASAPPSTEAPQINTTASAPGVEAGNAKPVSAPAKAPR
jgi:hypothetical protein